MTPLAALVNEQMRKKGWTPQQVQDRGVSHSTLFRYMKNTRLRQPPRADTLQALANALDLPLSDVQKAAVDSVGYLYQEAVGDTRVLIGALEQMTPEEQRAAAEELVTWLTDRGLLPPDG
jgi:transcriptional regulator with XRE-family HTH domain